MSEDAPFNGTRLAVVYLELQNVSDVLNPLLVDFHPPRFDLVDVTGKSIPQSPVAASIMTISNYTLLLPFDSALRFRVSVNGYGISKDSGIAFQLESGFWVVSADTREDRFLTGSFVVPELASTDSEGRRKDVERGNRVWRGTLNLPKLKVPLSPPK